MDIRPSHGGVWRQRRRPRMRRRTPMHCQSARGGDWVARVPRRAYRRGCLADQRGGYARGVRQREEAGHGGLPCQPTEGRVGQAWLYLATALVARRARGGLPWACVGCSVATWWSTEERVWTWIYRDKEEIKRMRLRGE